MEISNVHLVIVTGQAQANLIPILQFKPQVVVLAVSTAMKRNADQFEQLLKATNHYAENNILRFDNVPAVSLPDIEAKALSIYHHLKEKYPDNTITYHATGGTVLMALGFYKVFSQYQQTILYTDSANGQIEVIYPEQQAAIPIQHVLDMKTYLSSLGEHYQPESDAQWKEEAQKRQELTLWLGRYAKPLSNLIKMFNAVATRAFNELEQQKTSSEQQLKLKKLSPLWLKTLKKLNDRQICQWSQQTPNMLVFTNKECARYLAGIWLEEYVWLIAKDLDIDEVAANVKFSELENEKAAVSNEIDCVAVHNNRLLIIECKAIAFNKESPKNSDILYKLNTLGSRAGGLYGEKWLISANPVDDYTKNRADAYRIKILAAEQLKNLTTELEKWRNLSQCQSKEIA